MNGFTSFVATICLIAVGLLIGWVASSAFGANNWNALSAIGGWVGGLGAFYAAHVAIGLAKAQADRDTYKLKIEAYDVQGDVNFIKLDSEGNIVSDRPSGYLKINAYNSGLRPIELVKLVYVHEHGTGHLPITSCFVEAGKRVEFGFPEAIYFTKGAAVFPIYSNRLLDGDIKVVDAAGVYHEVHEIK